MASAPRPRGARFEEEQDDGEISDEELKDVLWDGLRDDLLKGLKPERWGRRPEYPPPRGQIPQPSQDRLLSSRRRSEDHLAKLVARRRSNAESRGLQHRACQGMLGRVSQLNALFDEFAEQVKEEEDRDLLNQPEPQDPTERDHENLPEHMDQKVQSLMQELKDLGGFGKRSPVSFGSPSADRSLSQRSSSSPAKDLRQPPMFCGRRGRRTQYYWEPMSADGFGASLRLSPRANALKGAAHCIPAAAALARSSASLPKLGSKRGTTPLKGYPRGLSRTASAL